MIAWRYKISLLVLKKIFHLFTALTHSKRNFVSPSGHVISSMSPIPYVCRIISYQFVCSLQEHILKDT